MTSQMRGSRSQKLNPQMRIEGSVTSDIAVRHFGYRGSSLRAPQFVTSTTLSQKACRGIKRSCYGIFFEKSLDQRSENGKLFSRTPIYPGDLPFIGEKEKSKNASDGYTIALNDIWATEVAIIEYELDGNNYKVKYRVTLWDHFGLDLPDIQPWKFAGYLDGFRAWFVLQHFLGYKPFITKITFTKEFKGSL